MATLAKNAQARASARGYPRGVRPHLASDGPLRIEVSQPRGLSGVMVADFDTDGRLFCSVKDRLATLYNLSGHSEWWARGRVRRSEPGALQLKLPGEVHRELRRDGPARFQVVLFDDALVAEARQTLDAPFRGPAELQLDGRAPAGAPIARLHALLRARAEPLALQETLVEALRALVGLTSAPRGSRLPQVRGAPVGRALEVIEARYTGPLSLDELAAHAELDKFHLCRAFRDEVGLPPYAYVTHRRISRAQQLLAAGVVPSEVAVQVGFCDQSQLHRHFKRILGVTPGQYASATRTLWEGTRRRARPR